MGSGSGSGRDTFCFLTGRALRFLLAFLFTGAAAFIFLRRMACFIHALAMSCFLVSLFALIWFSIILNATFAVGTCARIMIFAFLMIMFAGISFFFAGAFFFFNWFRMGVRLSPTDREMASQSSSLVR